MAEPDRNIISEMQHGGVDASRRMEKEQNIKTNNKRFPKGDIRNFIEGGKTTGVPELAAGRGKEELFGLSMIE